ncbi:hypothetical protein SPI_02907 [Niveomyces insectorum RCEF 264]|uniref:Uncharacterized protein n=1 Tax=Niveomyces insectorum RCEF 264 TaxID=1081102 RepID=A0A162MMV0_9HYPO|nr:hypothetical protein SPI_02907 [Niveomyces insectorum RCEF 264]
MADDDVGAGDGNDDSGDDGNNNDDDGDRQQQQPWATGESRKPEMCPSQKRWLKSPPSTSHAHALPWDLKGVFLTLFVVVDHLRWYPGHGKD